MSQDFYAAFSLGKGETTITIIDADGVALAGIQALLERSEEEKREMRALYENLSDENNRLNEENREIRALVGELVRRIENLEKVE